MSYIPAKKMPHVTAQSGEFDAETGKIIHIQPNEKETDSSPSKFSWIAGAAGAGLATAIALGAFFTLRSSSSRKPTRRRTHTAKRAVKPRRQTIAKRKTAA